MLVDDILDLYCCGEFAIYDLTEDKIVYDSEVNAYDSNEYYFFSVQSIDVENDKLIINI